MGTDLDAETRLRVSSSVYARPFGDEIVLLDFGRGEYFALDEVGAEVWRRIEKGESIGSIARAIADAYDVTDAQAEKDIISLISELESQSLVERASTT